MNPNDYRLVVTSGPTREWIDPVRFISNPSSGKTGWFIAKAGRRNKFKEVIFISGPVEERYAVVPGAVNLQVDTTKEMGEQVLKAMEKNTVLIMAAAPADYSPANPSPKKIKKNPDKELELNFVLTMDILKEVSLQIKNMGNCHLIGFAAETERLFENAFEKLKRKDLDFICANEVFRNIKGFDQDKGSWLIIDESGKNVEITNKTKDEFAEILMSFLISNIY